MAAGECPQRTIIRWESSNLTPHCFLYPTSDMVVPNLRGAVEDTCLKKTSKQIKKNKAVLGNTSQRYRPNFRT